VLCLPVADEFGYTADYSGSADQQFDTNGVQPPNFSSVLGFTFLCGWCSPRRNCTTHVLIPESYAYPRGAVRDHDSTLPQGSPAHLFEVLCSVRCDIEHFPSRGGATGGCIRPRLH